MTQQRLLVVDDEVNLLRAVEACLRVEGFDVVTARSGNEALVQTAGTVPDLIVSDIRMPGMSGYELARQLRQTPATSLVPIIFLTAKGETEDRIEGFRAGVDLYLTKPFEPEELVAAIRNILERVQRTHTQLAERLVSTTPAEPFFDEALTETENRVAEAVARGLSNKEIAAEMGISVRTVENHISHILDKKRFGNRVEIARYVFERQRR